MEEKVMTGVERIAAERKRQIEVEGYTAQHDDQFTEGELANAGACYAMENWKRGTFLNLDCDWPWHSAIFKSIPDNRIQELEKAGALIAAEIDRLQRKGELFMNKKTELTKAEAKRGTLEVWEYLAEHPECMRKRDAPPDIYDKVRNMKDECPLCELYREYNCSGCVLDEAGKNCFNADSPYNKWSFSDEGEEGNEARAAAAREIVEIVRTMETEE